MRRLAGHVGEEIGKQAAGPVGIGIGQRRARDAAPAEVIEPGGVAPQSRLDLAQAHRSRKLREQQRQELALAGQAAHTPVALVLIHKPVEDRPRNMLQNLMENAIVVPHDIDLLSCPKRRETSGTE